MAFDAGAIEARLELDMSKFDSDLAKAEAKAKRFEDEGHKYKISAVFDSGDISKARRMFAQLDNAISRDAAQRMKSGGQGSVLGALDSLFSTGQVAGAPTPQQAAQQGLLGKIMQQPAPGSSTSTSSGPSAGQVLSNLSGQNTSSTNTVRDVLSGSAPGNVSTEDQIRRVLTGSSPGNVSTVDRIKQVLTGKGPGNITTRDLIKAVSDPVSAGKAGDDSGTTFASHFASKLKSMFGGGRGGGGAGASAGGVLGQLGGGIGPGILGISPSLAGGLGAAGVGLAALPAAGAIGAGVGVIGAGAAVLLKTNKALQSQAKSMLGQLQATFAQAASPLIKPLESAFSQIPRFLKSIAPELHSLFAGAAPLIAPLLAGLESLVRGLLPGLVTLLHAAMPAFQALAQILGMLGRDLGSMFSSFAPVIRASSVVLKALFDVLGGILPVVGKLAAVFASALAPVVVSFAGIIRSLMPVLVIVGKVLASLAQAVLGDLVSAFGALARLLVDIKPAIQIFATALSQVFKVLENSGVFAILGDALEAIVPILAKLINTLVAQLAPILPVLITLLAKFSTILVDLLAAGLVTILTGITDLITHFKWLVPLLGIVTAAWVAWDLVMAANPIGAIIIAIVALVGGITELAKHWSQVWGDIKNWAADAWNFIYDGFGKYLLPLLGPAGLIALGAIELAKHWQTVMSTVQGAAQDLWHYLWDDFGAKILNFFTKTVPDALDIWLNSVKIVWDDIEIAFLKGVADIIGIMAKLPGPLGAPFRAARADINQQLAGIEGDAARSRDKINTDWQGIHGKTVDVTFKQVFSGQPNSLLHPKGAKATGGGVGSAGFYLVGEQGPEITWLPQGSHVIPAGPTTRIMGGLASGTGSWDIKDVFSPGAGSWVPDINSWFSKEQNAYIAQVIASGILKKAFDWATGGGYPGGGSSGPGAAAAQRYAAGILRLYGWGQNQMAPLIALWNQESGWRWNALNASSGAYGIPQSLPADKMAAAGADWRTNPATQIRWGLGYIRGKYGSPAGAEAHELADHWYDHGGWLEPGVSLAVNQTGQPEAVLTPAQSAALITGPGGPGMDENNRLLRQLITAVDRNAAATGTSVAKTIGGALSSTAHQASMRNRWRTGGSLGPRRSDQFWGAGRRTQPTTSGSLGTAGTVQTGAATAPGSGSGAES